MVSAGAFFRLRPTPSPAAALQGHRLRSCGLAPLPIGDRSCSAPSAGPRSTLVPHPSHAGAVREGGREIRVEQGKLIPVKVSDDLCAFCSLLSRAPATETSSSLLDQCIHQACIRGQTVGASALPSRFQGARRRAAKRKLRRLCAIDPGPRSAKWTCAGEGLESPPSGPPRGRPATRARGRAGRRGRSSDRRSGDWPAVHAAWSLAASRASSSSRVAGVVIRPQRPAHAHQICSGQAALDHYHWDGFRHYRFTHRFDERWYLAEYPRAAMEIAEGFFANAASHFMQKGWKDGLRPHA